MRGIILDLDDTLYRRSDFKRSGFDAIAGYLSHSWRCERDAVLATLLTAYADRRTGREFQAVCEEHRLPFSLLPLLVAIFRSHVPVLALDHDVRQALQQLRREGWRMVVLTNGDPAVQRRKIAALDLEALVDGVIYAEEHAAGGKPDPAVFRAALECLCVPATRCVCVGDDPIRDIDGARRLGLRTIQVLAPGRNQNRTPNADAVIGNAAEIPVCAGTLIEETADAA